MARSGAVPKVVTLGVVLMLAGCDDSAIIKKEESRSPDGSWIAREEIVQHGGPGQAGLDTYVYLVRANGDTRPIEILMLSDVSTATADVQINWRDNGHLAISRAGESTVEFQAVKCAGIEISLS